tara:strand:- start:534 stop:899 length:366 start_codon:yes stop_codon:yes gene_type:complete
MSIGLKLPITYDSGDGFTALQTFRETIKQNFKMLVLTNPGERVMVPSYGVGIKQYLFENYHTGVEGKIRTRIIEQAAFYLPVVEITEVYIRPSDINENILAVQIYYTIPDIGVQDLLKFTI